MGRRRYAAQKSRALPWAWQSAWKQWKAFLPRCTDKVRRRRSPSCRGQQPRSCAARPLRSSNRPRCRSTCSKVSCERRNAKSMRGRCGALLDAVSGLAEAAAGAAAVGAAVPLTAGEVLFTLEEAVVTTFRVGTCSRLWPTALSLAQAGAVGATPSTSAEAFSDSQG